MYEIGYETALREMEDIKAKIEALKDKNKRKEKVYGEEKKK